MDYEKAEEYNNYTKKMIELLYETMTIVGSHIHMSRDNAITVLNLDILAYLLYLGDKDGKLSDDGVNYIQQLISIDIPAERWYEAMAELKYDMSSVQIPNTMDAFIKFDNDVVRQKGGDTASTCKIFLDVLQAVGIGFIGADSIINQNELVRVSGAINKLQDYCNEKFIGQTPISVDPIDMELVHMIANSTDEDNICDDEILTNTSSVRSDIRVRFNGGNYFIPEDAVTFLKSREFVGNILIKLIRETSEMIERYAAEDASEFFSHFDLEIKKYQRVMLEGCTEIINDFAERGIYDVCLEDFISNLSSFNLVAELGENVLRKVNYEMQRLIDAKNKGMESAYKSAASTITGSGIRIFTNSLASLMIYSVVEKQIMLSQAKKADKQYEKAVERIIATSKNISNQICTNILINDFGRGMVKIIEQFNTELMNEYLLELGMHRQFDIEGISPYSENKSNAILENIYRVPDKKKAVVEAFEMCPFNIDVYAMWLKMGFFDKDTLLDIKQIFPTDLLTGMIEQVLSSNIDESERKITDYVTVLANYKNTSEADIIKQYFSKFGAQIINQYKEILLICSDEKEFDQWVRKNISDDMEQILSLTEGAVKAKVREYIAIACDEKRYKNFAEAGVISLEEIKIDGSEKNTYEEMRQEYEDLLNQTLSRYIVRMRERDREYKEACEKYNQEIDKIMLEINDKKEEIRGAGFFAFGEKRRLNGELAVLEERLLEKRKKEPIESWNQKRSI